MEIENERMKMSRKDVRSFSFPCCRVKTFEGEEKDSGEGRELDSMSVTTEKTLHFVSFHVGKKTVERGQKHKR